MTTPQIYDFREKALTNDKNVLLNAVNPDNTIDIVLAGALPSVGDYVQLTITQENTDVETQWIVLSVKDSSNHNKKACHAILKLDKNL